MNSILLIAHAPLAHALRECALHVFPDAGAAVSAVDIQPDTPPEESLALARTAMDQLAAHGVLVLTDVFGATPSNVARRLVEGAENARLLAGVNLPMLLRAIGYRHEPLEALVARALAGGTQGILPVASAAPQNQPQRATNDQERYDHQQ